MRLFIAIKIPGSLRDKVSLLIDKVRKIKVKAKFVEKENLHITLKFLGEVNENKVDDIRKILTQISLNTKSFNILLKGLGVFPSLNFIRVLWIGCKSEELIKLINEINEKLSALGFKKEKEFPHLTIARIKERSEKLIDFINKNKEIDIGSFKVNCFYLMKSKLTREGPIYSNVSKFSLL